MLIFGDKTIASPYHFSSSDLSRLGRNVSIFSKISIILEWENAEGLEQQEALSFLVALSKRIESYEMSAKGVALRILIIVNNTDAHEMLSKFVSEGDNLLSADRFDFVLDTKSPYYAKKMVGGMHAEAEVLVYADSDCLYSDGWLSELVDPILSGQFDVTYGATYAMVGDTLIERASSLAWLFPVRGSDDPLVKNMLHGFKANNFAVRREALLKNPIPRHHGSRSHGEQWLRNLRAAGASVEHRHEAWSEHKQFRNLGAMLARAWLLGKDRNIASQLYNNSSLTRYQSFKRAILDMHKRFGIFSLRAKSGVMDELARTRSEKAAVLFIGYLFQLTASISRFFYAATDKKPELFYEYNDLFDASRLLIGK